MSKPTIIYLMGKLGTLFGKKWELYVKSPSEAIRAIDVNTKGALTRYLKGPGGQKYYKIGVQSKDNLIDPMTEMNNPIGRGDIYIMPTIKGAGGKSGVGQAILGAVLIVIGYAVDIYSEGSASAIGNALIEAGIGMVLGGIVQLLTPMPSINASTGSDDDGRRSSFFEGNATAISQGGSVGIVYGRSMVSPMPISLAVKNTDNSSVGAGVGGPGCVTSNKVATADTNYLIQYGVCSKSNFFGGT